MYNIIKDSLLKQALIYHNRQNAVLSGYTAGIAAVTFRFG
ncbi:hypothetical protein SALWKB2_2205 [Snodgrassella alvi wkB2]|nr:hypothetical protein SALWKB2_2205 [Snodgrassella alvi wkB2]